MQKEISGWVAEMFIKSLHICHREYDSYGYPQVSTDFYSVYVLEIIVQRSSAAILSVTNAAIKKTPVSVSVAGVLVGPACSGGVLSLASR
ncbi:hypothetical protein [Rhodoblastus sp.]|uniref:hypothetical protein n=1 Tax=Rhodoblastus sp. TaxID=1962975 RepID=UPI003F94F76F